VAIDGNDVPAANFRNCRNFDCLMQDY
jgi:hypothetical protein